MSDLISLSGCQDCTLQKEWNWLKTPQMPVAIPSEPTDYRVMFIGEAPGKNEDDEGVPFVGKSGKYLRDEIPKYWKNKLYWSNCCRCRPPDNRTPTPDEVKCCSVYQERDLNVIKPHAILAVGDLALKWLWPTAWVTGMRGIPFPVKLQDGTPTWASTTFHPSYVMRQVREDYETGENTNAMLPVFRNDLKNFFDQVPYFASHPPKIYAPPTDIIYPKTEQEVYNLFDRLKPSPALDLETVKLKPYKRDARILTSAWSDGDLTFAFVVNWPGHVNDWGTRAFNTLLKRCKEWIAQNAAMEYLWAWYTSRTWEHQFQDTQVLARVLHKRTGVGSLEVLSRIYLGFNVKALSNMDKDKLSDYPIDQVLKYNALDAWATKKIWPILLEKATDCDLENYSRIIDSVKSCVGMELRGLKVDLDESERLDKELSTKMELYEYKARQTKEVMEFEKKEQRIFTLSEDATVGNVIVMYCGIQLPKTPKNKQYATDQDLLEKLAGQHPIIDLRLEYKEVQKLLSTYVTAFLSGESFGTDNLIHPSYTQVRTRTYRLSSENPNIQNFPKRKNKEIRRQIIAPEGHIFAAFDYGQLEGRVIQMFSGDRALLKAFIEDDDIHWKWLYRIIDLYPQYMDRLAKSSGETEEKEILKAGRTIIKTDFVFASFYGSTAKGLSYRTSIPLDITEQVVAEFWNEYPQAKIWVDNQFRQYEETGSVQSITGRIRNEVLPGNEPANSPVQGTAAEIVIEAQNALFFRAMKEDIYLMPRINIHDDLIFVFPDDNKLENYIRTVGQEIVKPRFPWITSPLMTEARVGYNWCDLEPVCNFSGTYYESTIIHNT